MATAKKSTTKKTTTAAAPKKAPVKKTAAKKTTTTKAATKTTRKVTPKIKVDTNTSTGIRVFAVCLGILAALAFQMPAGEINGEVMSGAKLLEICLNPETATGMLNFIFALILPMGLFEISTILLIVKSDKFMSIMAVMIDAIALVFLVAFMHVLGSLTIGWLVTLFSLVVGIIFEIVLYLIAEK